MHVVISGGTGFLGSRLVETLAAHGHFISILTRDTSTKTDTTHVQHVEWLGANTKPEEALHNVDAVINLAGASINERWTAKHKEAILQSRIEATREIVRLMKVLQPAPEVLINASAMGYYGISKTAIFTEDSPPVHENFLQYVCKRWEEEAEAARELDNVRVVLARFGLILGRDGGALPQMITPYRFFAGGPLGDGRQWYSWVHLDDAVEMLIYSIQHEKADGAMNVTAPEPTRMNEFGKTLAEVMNRPHFLPAPAFVVKTALGEMSVLVLEGQKVLPTRAEAWGFTFQYPELRPALQDLLI
ncbi:TIGR01777 family oxidoreductase [Salsuginibacillus kocurii]|uniref:TIGR01777 family oxidoreductase n=1 Tax=Salsuginibacillus kocurii TaxID=427078 RepID=UPI00037B0C79|nr:TIGR01777 family oxidoreductase [Salsuginibacillus kocurii]